MTVGVDAIRDLRERTGAGIVECKKALSESGGDVDGAITVLRKKGAAMAGKKAGREAKDGLVGAAISADGKTGALLEINCETDFVARNEQFQTLVKHLTQDVLAKQPGGLDAFLAQKFKDTDLTVKETVVEAVAKIGENIQVRRLALLASEGDGAVTSYIHMGGKIGVLIEVSASPSAATGTESFKTLSKDLTMQIAARPPQFVRREEVPQELLDKEKEIIEAQIGNKPANVLDKIISGKIEKFYSDSCLVDQPFVKDEGLKIKDVVAAVAKETGAEIEVRRFARFQLGEA
ncbi:MAG: elongation factor Ts [Candidatus Omnitrophica bacterium]|nr:elongation factor Ts [Candidatus Omnitrophota bacterium]